MNLLESFVKRNFEGSIIQVSKLSIWINVDSLSERYLYIQKLSVRYYKLFVIDLYNQVTSYSTRSMLQMIHFLRCFILNSEDEIFTTVKYRLMK